MSLFTFIFTNQENQSTFHVLSLWKDLSSQEKTSIPDQITKLNFWLHYFSSSYRVSWVYKGFMNWFVEDLWHFMADSWNLVTNNSCILDLLHWHTTIIYLRSSTDLFLQQFFHILHPWDWLPILHQEAYRLVTYIQHQLKEHWYPILLEIQLKCK